MQLVKHKHRIATQAAQLARGVRNEPMTLERAVETALLEAFMRGVAVSNRAHRKRREVADIIGE